MSSSAISSDIALLIIILHSGNGEVSINITLTVEEKSYYHKGPVPSSNLNAEFQVMVIKLAGKLLFEKFQSQNGTKWS